mgnify:FL=1
MGNLKHAIAAFMAVSLVGSLAVIQAIDFQAAKEMAFKVIKAGSLPGKVAPKTAGEIIGRSILPMIRRHTD